MVSIGESPDSIADPSMTPTSTTLALALSRT
jgi:hypothetical protein